MSYDPTRRRLLRGAGAAVVGVPLAGWLASCSSTEPGTGVSTQSVLDRGREQGHLTVAIFNEPPYTKLEPDGTVTGAEPDVLRAVLKVLGIDDIEGERIEYESMIPALQAGRVDVIAAGLFMKQSRCAEVAYSEPVIVSTESFAVPPGNPEGITTVQDVLDNPDLKIAVLPGGFEEGILKSAGVPTSQQVVVQDNVTGVEAISAERADAFFLPTLSLEGLAEDNDSFEITPVVSDAPKTGSGAAFEQSQQDDVDTYNEELAKFKETPEFSDIMNKWGFDPKAVEGVTSEELCKNEG
ncbi:MAG: ectoine/hydroxyectoine ABC transporter substrate-binding protein EhuB [Nocardioidaceae bacterium]